MNLIGMARNEVQLSRIKVTLKVLFRFELCISDDTLSLYFTLYQFIKKAK
mgnify:CR=1 FL=1